MGSDFCNEAFWRSRWTVLKVAFSYGHGMALHGNGKAWHSLDVNYIIDLD
jgi:hypothetical protein